jgi:hypothetical protein
MSDDPNGPVLLAVMPTEAEAAMLVGFLFSQGIKAFASGAGSEAVNELGLFAIRAS